MSDFMVTINTTPTRSFIVEGAEDHEAARQRVFAILGGDPGVSVDVIQTPISTGERVHFD